MGYTTEFTGRINLSRTLTEAEAAVINHFAEERHGGDVGGFTTPVPGYWCNWIVTADRQGIEWNGAEKFYDSAEWMQLVLDRFVTPLGVQANGNIDAAGESSGDLWRLKVEANVVSRVKAKITYA